MNLNIAQLSLQTQDMDWETFPDKEVSYGDIRWKIFAGGPDCAATGITFGVCEVPRGAGVNPHHHAQPEYYYILSGTGTVQLGPETIPVKPGSVIHIPGDIVHGIQNIGESMLSLVWAFPTDHWDDVKYTTV